MPSGASGTNPAKGARRKSQRPERASVGLVEGHAGEGCVVAGEKPQFYQHPFSSFRGDIGDEALTTTQVSRQPMYKNGQMLPKIATSVNASLSQYPAHGASAMAAVQLAQRTHHSMNHQVRSDDERGSKVHRGSLMGSHHPHHQQNVTSTGSNRGRLSGSTQHQMSPDERVRIQELRKKISEATKSSQQGIISPNPAKAKGSPARLLDYTGLSSSRKLHGIEVPPGPFQL